MTLITQNSVSIYEIYSKTMVFITKPRFKFFVIPAHMPGEYDGAVSLVERPTRPSDRTSYSPTRLSDRTSYALSLLTSGIVLTIH